MESPHNPYCSMARDRHSRSVSEVHEDVLVSPRLSHHNPNICFERKSNYQISLGNPEMAFQRSFSSSMASIEIPPQKPAAELVKEIATLELEVVNLERYLLSLYRTAFDQYLASSPTMTSIHVPMSPSECHARSLVPDSTVDVQHLPNDADYSNCTNDKLSHLQSLKKNEMERTIDCRNIDCRNIDDSSTHHLAPGLDSKQDPSSRENPKTVETKCVDSHQSLADHLGASIADLVPDAPCKLSEDIIKCISAIYCKLSNPPTQQMEFLPSPTPSVSTSSTFSPRDPCDSWSPQCHCEVAASPSQIDSVKDKNNPYSGMIEVPKISIDGDRFGYASKMLNIFRSLIQRLKTIDPRKMGREEQLAFWINIHNSLVMHAFLAYGLHQNHMRSTLSVLKAAYNVGGHSISAHVIQTSILGCQLHRPAEGMRSLFLPARKIMKGEEKHLYALDPPEPLVHFALCLGAYSDPALRIYKAKAIYQELEVAKKEFIQANISVEDMKIVLPKILHYFCKDASMELVELVEMVQDCMPEVQRKAIQGCPRRKREKCVQWSPYKSSFRYIVHRDLSEQ